MAKGKRSRKGRSGRRGGYNGNSQDRVRLRGHHLFIFHSEPDPSGASQFAVHPSPGGIGGTRFVDLNVIYSQYRWIDLKFTFLTSGTSGTPSSPTGAVTMGLIPNAANISVPVSARDIFELDHAALTFQDQTMPASLKVPPSLLHGEKDFYDTDASGGFDVPCHGLIAGTDALGVSVESDILVRVDWEIEYYGRKPGNIVLQSLSKASRLEEAAKMFDAGWELSSEARAELERLPGPSRPDGVRVPVASEAEKARAWLYKSTSTRFA